jgi:glutaminyl-peptide cyclotransferase
MSTAVLYEGTGLNGSSSIRKVKLETGEVLQRRTSPGLLRRGIAVWKSDIIELTAASNVAFVYDKATFARARRSHKGEGWADRRWDELIMSDGTDELRVLDPATFAERRADQGHRRYVPVSNLNELEFVKGDPRERLDHRLARIAPDTGRVSGASTWAGLALSEPASTSSTASRTPSSTTLRHGQALAEAVRGQDHGTEMRRIADFGLLMLIALH